MPQFKELTEKERQIGKDLAMMIDASLISQFQNFMQNNEDVDDQILETAWFSALCNQVVILRLAVEAKINEKYPNQHKIEDEKGRIFVQGACQELAKMVNNACHIFIEDYVKEMLSE